MTAKNIGWIGTGVMGNAMCKNLINAGNQLYVYNRTKEKTGELIELGATCCETVAEVANSSSVIFTMVGYPRDVKEVILGDNGVIPNAGKGSIVVDMTTSEPELAKQIFMQAQKRDVEALDAPVSGGDIGAKEGKLAIMVGGKQQVYEKIQPLFDILGENIAYMGSAGSGQHTKMSNQILIASTMIGVVESLLYSFKAGLNPDEVINVIGKGAASSWSINNLGRRIIKEDFDPGFFIKHFIKDMGIALTESKRLNLSLPGLALVHQFYIAAVSMGYENLGTQGLYCVYQKMNGIL